MEGLVERETGGINWYNVLQGKDAPSLTYQQWLRSGAAASNSLLSQAYHRHVKHFQQDSLDDLMNGAIKRKLGIPSQVTWGGQSDRVFTTLSEDFMNPVTQDVEILLNSTDLKVVIYTGQLDLIVDTVGTEAWLHNLNWDGLAEYKSKEKKVFAESSPGVPSAYVKKQDNLAFYWILKAGHMVPSDAPRAALKMLHDTIYP